MLFIKILLISLLLVFSNSVLADPKMDLGLDVYNNKAQCGVCHTLQAAGSKGLIGPNLDQLKPQIPQIIFAVTNGIGVMQSWEGILTYEEIEAVAYYTSLIMHKIKIIRIFLNLIFRHFCTVRGIFLLDIVLKLI